MNGSFSSIQNDVLFQNQIDYALAHQDGGSNGSAMQSAIPQKSRGRKSLPKKPSRDISAVPEIELESKLELLKAKRVLINAEKTTTKIQAIKDKLNSAISAIEAELIKRKSTSDTPVITNAPDSAEKDVEESKFGIGMNVSIGALIVGIGGFVWGKHKGKNGWGHGILGAVIGGVGAYGLTKYYENKSATKTNDTSLDTLKPKS